MRFLVALFLWSILSFQLNAQLADDHSVCGLSLEDDDKLIQRTRAAISYIDEGNLERSDEIRYLPIKWTVFHRNDGSGGASDPIIETAHCNLNDFYTQFGTNIQFYLAEINHVNNTNAYEDHWNAGENTMINNKDWEVINVYVPISANYDPNGNLNVAGYYSPGADWIVVGQGNLAGSTLAHELGHYLALPHPFRGWDNEFYDPDVHGEQVGTYAPGGFGQNAILNEKQDGSNCSQAGDLICDTPPDYNHFGPSWGCNYTGGAKDPDGTLIDPDESNVMAYFLNCNPKIMSQGQIDVINADINQRIAFGNLYELDNPNPGPVSETTIIAPEDATEIQNNLSIDFEWAASENAEGYELWIDWVPTFSLDPYIISTTETSLTFNGADLIQEKKYYWRVKPVSAFNSCTDFTPTSTFFTSILSSVNDNFESERLTIYPNPASADDKLTVDWVGIATDVDWQLLDLQGRMVATFNSANGNTSITVNTLSSGVYLLKGRSEDKNVVKKIIVR